MTKLSTANQRKLNHMNRASHDVDLGLLLYTMESGSATADTNITALQLRAVTAGSTLVSSAQATASAIVINSGLGTIKGYMTQIFRSGSTLGQAYPYSVYNTAGSITILPVSGSYVVLANDVVEYIVW